MRLRNVEDYNELSRVAAGIIKDRVAAKKDLVLGLVTGGTVEGMYEELVVMYESGAIDFSQTTKVNTDEYYKISPDNPQSYAYFMRERFFGKVGIRAEQTHLVNGMADDPQQEAERYERTLLALGPVDLQILGLGRDGHIAFIEPNDSYFQGDTALTGLTEQTIADNARFFESEESMPRQAITIGLKAVMRSKEIVLLVSGSGKSGILNEVMNGQITPKVPGSILQLHGNVLVVADKAAAEKMGRL